MLEGKRMEFFITKFGSCIKHNDKWYNLSEEYETASDISSDIAISTIQAKRKKEGGINSYECKVKNKDGKLLVMKGPYGFYLKFTPSTGKATKNDNYFLPKDIRDDEEIVKNLTIEQLLEYVVKAQEFRDAGGYKQFEKKKVEKIKVISF
jgi:topoisomerase IA-like protein